MSLLNDTQLGDFSTPKSYKPNNIVVTNDLDSTINRKYDGLLIYEVINKKFSMRKLLFNLKLNPDMPNMYCPFHDDELTGKPSAKYHPDTDMMYCFSEGKVYTAYHVLKLLYQKDMRKVFNQVWNNMSQAERQEFIDKHDTNLSTDLKEGSQTIWYKYKDILSAFKKEKVNYTQMKNGIYKVLKEDFINSQEEEV
jgi:hypothetical protein